VPLPKQKSQRQSLKPNVGRILTALLKRDRQIPRRSYRIPDNQQNADKRQQKVTLKVVLVVFILLLLDYLVHHLPSGAFTLLVRRHEGHFYDN